METATRQSVRCSACGQTLALDHQGACPSCGGTSKTHDVHLTDTIHLSSSLTWQHTREWYEKHPVLLPIVIAITVASPFLGLLLAGWIGVAVGLGIGVVTFLLGLRAVTKVREIREGRG
jgi:hypothetical protein